MGAGARNDQMEIFTTGKICQYCARSRLTALYVQDLSAHATDRQMLPHSGETRG